MSFRFSRSEVRLPIAQLNHVDISLSFYETHVDGIAVLTLTARETLTTLELDARELEIFEVAVSQGGTPPRGVRESGQDAVGGRLGEASLPKRADDWGEGCAFSVDPVRHKLVIPLPQPLAVGETLRILTRCRCVPSDALLEGIYRDVTPPGAPQQYMSQCQQWGFQRILPVIDDCTAKCTFRTTLEGDARYSHLISNGDIDHVTNPDGRPVLKPDDPTRQVITFVNPVPMAPYLFIACAGTWDVLADEVRYPDGRRIALEYLVPPGKRDGARLPMEILKRSILWQHERLGYAYPFDTYRTICMEKSNYGGMENVGNTTIITEAALIDEMTSDARLIYAHGVIVHEYEHNHCGSGVTMESPFDMWLNEAYTVDIERQFTASVFDPAFMRLREMDAVRAPGVGPLAMEDTGKFGQIVREGFNDPDELVDGVTYVKAPEVLNMLRQLLGPDVYEAATRLYFERYVGGNANTAQFLACFEEAAGQDLKAFSHNWLFTAGYPQVSVRYTYDPVGQVLAVSLKQTRTGVGNPFVLPFSFVAVDAEGHDLAETDRMIRFDTPEQEIRVKLDRAPAFLSVNRDGGFYGTCRDGSVTPEQLTCQVRKDRNAFNRVEAMRRLTDLERKRLLEDLSCEVSREWLSAYRSLLDDRSVSDGIKGYLLKIDEQPFDRALHPHVREQAEIRRRLVREAARRCGESTLIHALKVYPEDETVRGGCPARIERRFLRNAVFQLLCGLDTPAAHDVLEQALDGAGNMTDRLNALTAIWQSSHPQRQALLMREGRGLRKSLGGYLGYLQVIGQAPGPEVFEWVAAEEKSPDFQLNHPGFSRALYVPLSLNNAQIWTAAGLDWLEKTVVRLAPVNEVTTLRLIAPCQGYRGFAPDLRAAVHETLLKIARSLGPGQCPSVAGRLAAYLSDAPER